MDAAAALPPPTSPAASTGPVSLRPGGSCYSFRPNSGVIGGSVPSDSLPVSALKVFKSSGFASGLSTFSHLQEKSSKPRNELIRYSKEDLLRLKDDCKSLPEEISTSDVQRTSTVNEDSTRREPTYIPERSVEPDNRDWRGRTPMPVTLPDQERLERPRDQYRERPKETRGPGDRQTNVPLSRVSEQSPVVSGQSQGPLPSIVKAASPWSARRGVQSEKEKVIKTVKGILNKLTPEKYDTLLEQLTQSGIATAGILQDVISLVFDKAVLEPTFCSMYSLLCVDLSKALPEFPATEYGEKPITFRRVLLNTCQSEFEGADALRAEIRQLTAPEQEQQRVEKERNVKLRTLGNIKFIGELFKQKMIPEKIVHACIQELLGVDPKVIPAEENVEALCQLLSTVGKALDANVKSRLVIDSYFNKLRDLGVSNRLPPRIRFMVRDVLDFRGNKWIPRREEIKAKTISEVHAEAEQTLGLRAGSASLKVGRSGSVAAVGLLPGGMMPGAPGAGRAGGMMPGAPGFSGSGFVPPVISPPYGTETEGWETVNFRKGRAPTTAYTRPPISRTGGLVPRNLPQGTGGSFIGKSSALLGSSAPFTTLRNGPISSDSGPRVPNIIVSETPAKVAERDNRQEVPLATPPLSSQQVTELKKKSESLLNEYFSIVDLKEALLCVKELGVADLHPQFVHFVLAVVLDKRDRERVLVSKLFDHLYFEKVLTSEAIRAGFLISAVHFEDLAVDAPLAPKLMGKLLASLVVSKATDISLLVEVSKEVEDDCIRRAVLVSTFKLLLSETSQAQTLGILRSLSNEDLSLFGNKTDVLKVLKGEGLDALAASL